MNRTSFSRTTGTRARSLGALFVSVAIGLCQACAMDTQESAGPEPEVGCGAHALLPDPYTQCSQILAEHLIAQYEADRDPDLAGHLLNWFCGPGAIAENASLIIDGQPLAAWLGGCAQAQDLYNNSSFAFHALDEVADPEVLQAWQDCMGETRSARDGLVCEIARSEEGADTLRVNYYWNSEDSSPELRMEWVVQNATPKTPPLPSAVHEGGDDYVLLRITDPDNGVFVGIRTRGDTGDGTMFMKACEDELAPAPAPYEPPAVADPPPTTSDTPKTREGALMKTNPPTTMSGGDCDPVGSMPK